MDNSQVHDDGVGAAVAGALGGFVQWARSPDGWRKLLARVVSGLGCAYLANAALKYFYADVPYDLRWGLSFIAGVVSAVLIDFALRAANRLTAVADRQIDSRFGITPNATDGRNTTATTDTRTVTTSSVVAVGGTTGGVAGDGVVPHNGVGGKGAAAAGGERASVTAGGGGAGAGRGTATQGGTDPA